MDYREKYRNALAVAEKYRGTHIMLTEDLIGEMFPELKNGSAVADTDADLEKASQTNTDKMVDRLPTDGCCGSPIWVIREAVKSAFMAGADWRAEQMEENRLEHCGSLTEEQSELERTFVIEHVKRYNRTPTILDAIEYGKGLQEKRKTKFKIGDLVRKDDGGVYKVVEIKEMYYNLECANGRREFYWLPEIDSRFTLYEDDLCEDDKCTTRTDSPEEGEQIEDEFAQSLIDLFERKFPDLPTLKGENSHKFKTFLNTCQQIFGLKYWGAYPKQAVLFEKMALLWATWGVKNLDGFTIRPQNWDALAKEDKCTTCTNDKGCVACKGGEQWTGGTMDYTDVNVPQKDFSCPSESGGLETPCKEDAGKRHVLAQRGFMDLALGAANDYVLNIRKGYPRVMDETDRYIRDAFLAGAEWYKKQTGGGSKTKTLRKRYAGGETIT